MCGIIGYTGSMQVPSILLNGLTNLEYRGYDSSGIAVIDTKGDIIVRKSEGKLKDLVVSLDSDPIEGIIGIGHTRWATHGEPNHKNAHPHGDCSSSITVVHNGIVENYREIKDELISNGHTFKSDTDSEVIPHLIESQLTLGFDIKQAIRNVASKIMGAHAVVIISRDAPNVIIAFKKGNAGGIVIGATQNGMIVASDLPAIVPYTRQVNYLESNEIAYITPESTTYESLDGISIEKAMQSIPFDPISAVKGKYKHFMMKEISEQPEATIATLGGRLSFESLAVNLDEISLSQSQIKDINRVIFVGMGTSYNASMVGKHMMEQLAGIHSQAENASEFRYNKPILGKQTIVVAISQSGETADTLAAVEMAKAQGAYVINICNTEGSQSNRISDETLYLRAGPEIGVASTKTYLCSLEALYLLAIDIGTKNGHLDQDQIRKALISLSKLPDMIGTILADNNPYVELADKFYRKTNFLFLGRGVNYPTALEGALKLKEISYIHSEGCAAGEMKHGPIALIDENMPVLAIAPKDELYDKMLNNIAEVKARGGTVIALATKGDTNIANLADEVIYIPEIEYLLTPVLAVVPLQLLAYNIAIKRGCDVDQPRHLAKSVTVE